MFLLHDLLVKAGQVNFFHIAHVEHVSAKEKKCNIKKKRLLILRIKYSLANGIELLDCWEDTMCVLLNVIHAI